MEPVVHRYDPPDRFVAGTVGEPGSRTFFLQARAGTRLTSVLVEKQQVEVLASRLEELLDEVMADADYAASVPALPPVGTLDNAPLEQPIEEEFRAGTMTLAWDPSTERVVIEVFPVESGALGITSEALEDPDPEAIREAIEESEPTELFVVHISPGVARAFVQRASALVSAGRPPCPFCGEPLDPDGHLCVRANGFKRRP